MLGIRRQHLYSRLERYGIVSAERTDDVLARTQRRMGRARVPLKFN
jgi:hypothetical protein